MLSSVKGLHHVNLGDQFLIGSQGLSRFSKGDLFFYVRLLGELQLVGQVYVCNADFRQPPLTLIALLLELLVKVKASFFSF